MKVESAFGLMPAAIAREAKVCLASWSVIGSRPRSRHRFHEVLEPVRLNLLLLPARPSARDNQAMSASVSIPRRFNGPLDSGNGGYCSGVLAGFVGGAAEISLRRPVPLDTALDVVREDESSVRLRKGETLVAEGRPATELEVDVPAPVTPDDARVAATRYRGRSDGLFSRCFVCGRARDDAFGVFAGAVEGRGVVASPWTPPSWTADAAKHVRPEFVWAVLDCPTYFAVYTSVELPISVLARLSARIDAPVIAGEEHVIIAWALETDGRKRHAGSAVLSDDGEALAVARALLIEPRAG
jgi:hypothetical protein